MKNSVDALESFISAIADSLVVTIHPSALLRFPDPAQKKLEYARFVEELKQIKSQSNEP